MSFHLSTWLQALRPIKRVVLVINLLVLELITLIVVVVAHDPSRAEGEAPFLIKDINTDTSGSVPSHLIVMNGVVYFAASDPQNGMELWRSDGTPEGTVLVKDITPGPESTFAPDAPNGATLAGDDFFFFFVNNYQANSTELWRSDGTVSGTVLIKGGFMSSLYYLPDSVTMVNGTLFFNADDGAYGVELWKSDGTFTGTVMVKDIVSGAAGSYPVGLADIVGTLYFQADDGLSGWGLWQSNGTLTGTVLVKGGFPRLFAEGRPVGLLTEAGGGQFFFVAEDSTNGVELWHSDGTFTGTVMVKDIYEGLFSSIPYGLTFFNNKLIFAAFDGVNGYELWQSDGTLTGTVLLKGIWPGPPSGFPSDFTILNDTLLFVATDDVHGSELWRSDGTFDGTVLVADIHPGPLGAFPAYLTNVGAGQVAFRAYDGLLGNELWQSDGTLTGTRLVKDIDPGGIG